MTTHDIENLSFAALKAKRAELAESLKATDPAELAVRYIQARTDAKQRDEAMAQQGATITALQQGLAAATEKAAGLEGELGKATREGAQSRQSLAEHQSEHLRIATDLKGQIGRLCDENRSLATQRDEARSLATKRREALGSVMKLVGEVASKTAPLLDE